MQHLPIYKKSFVFIALLLALVFVTPVLADYLGPDRTVTTYIAYCRYVQKRCAQQKNGQWEWNTVEDWDCSHGSQGCSGGGGACNKANDNARSCERDEGVREETVTYDPATIAGSVNCTVQNGWCNGASVPELALSASEPLSGYTILLIEGTRNGESFACQDGETNCTIPMLEGNNKFNFWALSSWGDSSLMGSQTARVDTFPPEVGLSVTGTSGHNGWYKSLVDVSATASDATSGVATFEVAVNGGVYETYAPVAFEDGRHTLQFRVVDQAGNVFESPEQKFNVDTVPPTIDLPKAWRLGKDIDYRVWDEGSGLASVRIVIEDEDEKYAKVTWDRDASGKSYTSHIDWNGEFKDRTVAPPGTYQLWVKAKDVAGNERFVMGKIIVPEPNVPLVALPTADPLATEAALLPPAELVEVEDSPVTAGEGITSGSSSNGTTTQTILLTTGSAGAAASTTTSGVLWGTAAAAAISAATAYAVETTRKRKEAEEAQAAAARAEVAEDKARRAEHGMTKAEKQEAKAQQSESHDAKVKDRKEQRSWANPAEEKAKLKWEQERDAAYAQQVWDKWQQEQIANKTLGDTADGGLDGNIWTSDEGAPLQDAVDKELFAHATLLGSVGGTNGGLDGNIWTSDEGAPRQDAIDKWVLDSHVVGTAPQETSTKTKPPSVGDKFKDWLTGTIIDPLKDKAAPAMDTISDGIDWIDQTIYQPYVAPTLENIDTFVQEEIVEPVKNSSFVQTVVPTTIAALALTSVFAYQQVVQNSHIFDAARENAQNEWQQVLALHPYTEENTDPQYLLTHPYETFQIGYDSAKAIANSLAGYADAIWQQSPMSEALSSTLEQVGDSVCQPLGEGWDRRCGAVFYFGASLIENPADTVVAIGTKLIADPVAGFWETGAYMFENYNLPTLVSDVSQSIQEYGLLEGLTQYGSEQLEEIKRLAVSDPEIQSFLILVTFLAVAAIPIVGTAVALGGGIYLVGQQTLSTLAEIDKQLQAADGYEEAMEYAASKEVRRNLAVTITLVALVAFGAFRSIKEANAFRAYQESLSPSAQTAFYDLPLAKRLAVYDAVQKLGLTPAQLEYYLMESARPGSPLAGLPLTEALRISGTAQELGITPSQLDFYLTESARPGSPLPNLSLPDALRLSVLAEQTGKGTFLMNYVTRYGYTDALKIASPEVIKGMTSDQFLVQAQDILSNDAGYNITPENVFTSYPGSTIGKNSTFITNEAAIRNIIGDFNGKTTIYITSDQAVALANALGLKPRTLVDGFRISKISNLGSLDLSYPLAGNDLFCGPGQGLPGGGPEITINPPVLMNSPNVVNQITIQVYP